MSERTPRRARALVRRTIATAASVLFAMWIAGHWTYTSLGIDREEPEANGIVLSRYARVRWPGDGSLWIGGGHWREPSNASRVLDSVDLAGVFFAPPRRPEPASAWNRLGFWWVRDGGGGAPALHAQSWVGIPGWLPVVLLALPLRRARAILRSA